MNSTKTRLSHSLYGTSVTLALEGMFIVKADRIFNANQNSWKQFDRISGGKIRNLDEFEALINHSSFDTNHPIFNFIQSQ